MAAWPGTAAGVEVETVSQVTPAFLARGVLSRFEAAAIIAGSELAGFQSSFTRTGGFENMYTCQGSGCCCGKKLGLSCIFL